MQKPQCPFQVGDLVRFTPSERTLSLYQDIQRFGINPGEIRAIAEIRNGCYLFFANGSGGWPWGEFSPAN